ncbi:amino acid transporter [Leptomonas seymouri]|uniref:Amino acid transporter n=1 Tax=Leptomonas seymouri TaxID=5684 RepID=A0A0N1HUR1_LEPSE|nr:amino acid transporter [Leptomonas seymouri]|eukprot:KPI84074.1 amino acid transporter [Leptomonas seymouri]
MEKEAPRLAQLPGGNDDSGATVGLRQACSPTLSQCMSVTSVAEMPAVLTELSTAVRSPLPAHSVPHNAVDTGAGSHVLLRCTPPRHNNSSLSNTFSLQSNLVTPSLSAAHTPRGKRTAPQLSTFISIPVTPAAEDVLERGGGDPLHQTASDGNLPTQVTHVDEGGAVVDVSKSGKCKGRVGHRDHFHGSVGEDSIEFTSFGLDTSFMSNSSSPGRHGERTYASLYGAVFHIFKGNVGAGVFLLPTYYRDVGYIVGPICIALLGALMVDCTVSLLQVKHRINRVEVKTYPAVVEFVLGGWF